LGQAIKNKVPYAKMVSIEDSSKIGIHLTSFRTKSKARESIEELKAAYPALLKDQKFTIKGC